MMWRLAGGGPLRWQYRKRSSSRWRGVSLAVACVVAGVVAGCGVSPAGGGDVAVWHLPAGWHEITPPDGRSIASYAVSPDVPGLLVACIGAPVNHTSASPMGAATLWRSRDGGAHWQALDVRGLNAGCTVTMPPGGQGTIFVENTLPPSGPQTLIASRDGGDTWQAVHFMDGTPNDLSYNIQQLIERGVMRDGRLYAVGMPGAVGLMGQPGEPFAVSDDDGTTWTRIEPGSDPLYQRGYTSYALAADYRAPGAWYRLLAFGSDSELTPGLPTLEHSADGGRTWQVVGTAGTPDLLVGANGYLVGGLATTPAAPARLCLALEAFASDTALQSGNVAVAGSVGGLALPRGPLGPPPPTPLNDILAGSTDGGITWQGAIVAEHRRDYGGFNAPSVSTDAQGACVATDSSGDVLESQDSRTTYFRLIPGAGTQPATIGSLDSGLDVGLATLYQPSAGGGERLVAVTTASIIRSCNYSCADGRVTDSTPAHLIWSDVGG